MRQDAEKPFMYNPIRFLAEPSIFVTLRKISFRIINAPLRKSSGAQLADRHRNGNSNHFVSLLFNQTQPSFLFAPNLVAAQQPTTHCAWINQHCLVLAEVDHRLTIVVSPLSFAPLGPSLKLKRTCISRGSGNHGRRAKTSTRPAYRWLLHPRQKE